MLSIKCLIVGQLATNCYLVIDRKTSGMLIIDPGDDADYIVRQINDENAIPTGIVATHGHFDHILAVTELKLAWKIPFYIHEKDEFLLARMRSSAKHFLGIDVDFPPLVSENLREDKLLKIGNTELKITSTPGHTPGSVTIFSKEDKIAFVGDLVFANGIGRTDFEYSDKELLFYSIDKILKLEKEVKIFPGHGEATTVSSLRKIFNKHS